MKIKDGASIQGLDIRVRPALIEAERIWKARGRPEGTTITCGLDGEHSARSLHYYGLAVDFRTRYWTPEKAKRAFNELKSALKAINDNFDVIYHHKSHIHAEYDEK